MHATLTAIIKHTFLKRYRNLQRWVAPFYYLKYKTIQHYETYTGTKPNLRYPNTITDKLVWLSLYYYNPRHSEYTDKYAVRNFASKVMGERALVPLLGIWEDVDQIDFESLPSQFVLKATHGSGYNIICTNKSRLDIDKTKSQLKSWTASAYGISSFQFHYFSIPPRIICEEYLPAFDGQQSVIDYKLYCLNGEPYFFLVCSDRVPGTHNIKISSYSPSWERIHMLRNETQDNIPSPLNLEKMIQYARTFSDGFPFVRVDFYEIHGHLYFGELTFTPDANYLSDNTPNTMLQMGQKLKLPHCKKAPRALIRKWAYLYK